MKPVVVSDVLAVGEFPTSDQLAILAKAGFKAIINNQPDGEVARFESAAHLEAMAKGVGLAYAYAPLSSRTPTGDQLALYAAALSSLPSPIYAFCYSGARSAAGCALLLTGSMEVDAIIHEFGAAGFDLSGLRPWLEEERARRTGQVAPSGSRDGGPDVPTNHVANAGGAALAQSTAAVPDAPRTLRRLARGEGLPGMIVVQPRAAGYGGFAM